MRFKTDENLPKGVAAFLVRAGHDALRVDELGLNGMADPAVATACRTEHRVIVTLDTDFGDVRRYPPADYAGIIVLRPRRQSVPRLLAMTARFQLLLTSERLDGKLWIVDEGRIRIRPEEES